MSLTIPSFISLNVFFLYSLPEYNNTLSFTNIQITILSFVDVVCVVAISEALAVALDSCRREN